MIMKDLMIFLAGSLILAPILIFAVSGGLGMFLAIAYAFAILYSTKFFPKFWARWWRINLEYIAIFEGR